MYENQKSERLKKRNSYVEMEMSMNEYARIMDLKRKYSKKVFVV